MAHKSVGIVGASGYSGEMLVRLLARHPHVSSLVVASRSLAGQRLDAVLPALRGRVGDTCFVASEPEALAARPDVDCWFLALPHGVAAEFALPLVAAGRRVIDLSADFRLGNAASYATWYGATHPAPEWLARTPYVLPEFTADGWQSAPLIAAPGCYPTSILLPLLPLVRDQLIDPQHIVIHSMSGVSGAGKKATAFYSFCERANSVTAYGMANHRHLAEIEEQLAAATGAPVIVQFTPHLIPVAQGIASTIVAPARASIDAIYDCWHRQFAGRPCVGILPQGTAPETRDVVNTNRIDFSATYDERTRNVVITSALDNLVKGAGGQAIQIFNLLDGLPENCGL
jgi:N-acetyl-gamma-glutamyl-phosphate reductase